MTLSPQQIRLLKQTFLDYQQTSEFLERPLIIDKAQGLYYWDSDGKRYFDSIGGIFVASLGHRHPRVVEAVKRQLDLITFAPPLHGVSDITLQFVDKLASVSPQGLTFVKPYSGGSESVESALKFVRQYYKQTGRAQKYKFVSRYYGYHGSSFGAMSASGTGKRKTPFEPQMAGFLKVMPPTCLRDRFDSWEECNRFAAGMFEDVIVQEDPNTVAGIIVEPVGNTGGIITPTNEYYRMLREICDRHDVMLIFDEIITGYGKTGSMFAAQTYGVTPDIICCGKGMSNGALPLAAMIAKEEMADAFWGSPRDALEFAHGHTFAGNPLGAAVGIAVIDEIVDNKLTLTAQRMGDYMAQKLEGLKRYGVVREVRGKGVLRGVELVRDTDGMEPFPELGNTLKRTALENGLILRIDPSWFAVAPALIAKESDLDEMYELIERSLVQALELVTSADVHRVNVT